MSFSTTDNNNYQTGGYGGGKSSGQQPLYKSVTDTANQSASQMPGLQGQLASIVTKNAGNLVDAAYSGGPPRLDLSGLFKDAGNQVANTIGGSQQTPQQKVAQSQAGGGILKLRQPPQPFNPNPTPNPGFGGGKGITPMPGITPGFGGGKGVLDNMMEKRLPVERGSFDPEPFNRQMNTIGVTPPPPQPVPMMKNFQGGGTGNIPVERGSFDPEPIRGSGRGELVGGPAGKPIRGRPQPFPMMKNFTG